MCSIRIIHTAQEEGVVNSVWRTTRYNSSESTEKGQVGVHLLGMDEKHITDEGKGMSKGLQSRERMRMRR